MFRTMLGFLAVGFLLQIGEASSARAEGALVDKTLVVWVSPATLDQGSGSALTIDNADTAFDGIVFGELEPKRWMAGSNGFVRTEKNQAEWPAETVSATEFVQIAIAYHDREVSIYRDGKPYAKYTMGEAPKAFGSQAVVMFGRRHIEARDGEKSFAGRIRDARVYAEPLSQDAIAKLQPGVASDGAKPWAWWSFADDGLRDKTGRFNNIQLAGDVRIADGCLVLGGKGATVFMAATPDATDGKNWAPVPKAWSPSDPVPDEVLRSTRLLREKMLADPYRPGYHFCTTEDMGLPGDPNGAFYHDGRYHLMYLYSRNGSGFCWGHISSSDLVHWRHQPDSIGPGGGDEGCFSGGGFVDDDGTAYVTYWMLWGAKGIGMAASRSPFDRWTKLDANPVIRSTEWGVTEIKSAEGKPVYLGSADPSNIWKHNGRYYMLTGNLLVLNKVGRNPDSPVTEQGDRLYLFGSDDLKTWNYMNIFYDRNPEWTDRSEDNMCPSFLPLPSSPEGGPASGKHLLLFIAHNKGCQYYVGDYRDDHFFPANHGRMSWVDNTYFAPEALLDGKGRQIMWAWLTDNPPTDRQQGWSGVYGLPRTLWLGEDGTLRMRPVPELETLRSHEKTWNDTALADGKTCPLEGVIGDSCEFQFEVTPGTSKRCGVKVRAAADGSEETLLYYDAEAKQLVFDSTRSGQYGRKVVEQAPLALQPGEPLKLRVFVDKSVIEVYANDRQAIGRRVFPTHAESLGVVLFSEGGEASFKKLVGWQMSPSNPF